MEDVTKPGKTPASATSRPIIVGRGPTVQDPMVTSDVDAETPAVEVLAPPSVAKKVIMPLAAAEDATPPATTPPEKATESIQDETTDAAVVDAVIEQVTDKKKLELQNAEEKKRSELIEKLVADKKYFVPTKSPHQKRNNRIAILLLSIVLLAVGGVIAAIDAGILDIGITLPFDLIQQ